MTGDALYLAMILAGLATFGVTMAVGWIWGHLRRGDAHPPSKDSSI